jgi:hypothetical protein
LTFAAGRDTILLKLSSYLFTKILFTMKRIILLLTVFTALTSAKPVKESAANELQSIYYTSYRVEPMPTVFPVGAPLADGLKGKFTFDEYCIKTADICNKLFYGPAISDDGALVTPENINYMYNQGFDAIVYLDWVINSNTYNGFHPFLDTKKNRIWGATARCYKLADGSVLVMRKNVCENVFVRLLQPEAEQPVSVIEKQVTVVKLVEKQSSPAIKLHKAERNYAYSPFNPAGNSYYQQGVNIIIRPPSTPIKVGGGDPGGGRVFVGGGDPGH